MKRISFLLCSLLPFIFFIVGYYGAYRLWGTKVITVPSLIGTQLLSLPSCVDSHLTIRIQEEVEDAYLLAGTIIQQHPAAGQKIKIQQPLELTITRRPCPGRAPQLIGMYQEQALKKAEAQALRCKFYFCSSAYPTGYCIAQYPNADQELAHKTIVLYISSGSEKMYLVPDFKGLSIKRIREFLEQFKENNMPLISYEVYPKASDVHTSCDACVVQSQKPAAGSFWDISKPQALQLSVNHAL